MESWTVNPTDIVVWVVCGIVVLTAAFKVWPVIRKGVYTFDLVASLPPKLDAIGERFDEQDRMLEEVRRMVTENHHENPDPTLPDRISDVRSAIQESEARAQQRWDEHLAYSATIAERVAAVEKRLEATLPQPDEN